MMQTRQSSDKGGENAKKESNVMKEFLNEKLVSENEELMKKNENLAEAVKKLKMFINSEDLEKREEEMGSLKMENEKLKEKLWTSKLKVKDLIQKLYEKDSQLEEKDEKIEGMKNSKILLAGFAIDIAYLVLLLLNVFHFIQSAIDIVRKR